MEGGFLEGGMTLYFLIILQSQLRNYFLKHLTFSIWKSLNFMQVWDFWWHMECPLQLSTPQDSGWPRGSSLISSKDWKKSETKKDNRVYFEGITEQTNVLSLWSNTVFLNFNCTTLKSVSSSISLERLKVFEKSMGQLFKRLSINILISSKLNTLERNLHVR